jgi:hypothetical protein
MSDSFFNLEGEEIVVKTQEEIDAENKFPGYDLFRDVMASLNFKTKHLFLEDPVAARKAYNAFVINLCYSYVDKFGKNDSVLYANEMNIRPGMDPRLQYDFYFHGLTKAARFGKGAHAEEINMLETVSDYYNCSLKKAKEMIDVLTPDQLETIKDRMFKGEVKNDKPKRGKRSK